MSVSEKRGARLAGIGAAACLCVSILIRLWAPPSGSLAVGFKAESLIREPIYYQVLSFGQLAAAIDWLWLGFVQDTPVEKLRPGEASRHFLGLDLITTLDPLFKDAYVDGANYLVVIRQDVEGASRLLEKGLDAMGFGSGDPRDWVPGGSKRIILDPIARDRIWGARWSIPLLLAYVRLFEQGDLPGASDLFRQAAGLPGAPPYLDRLAARLGKPGGQYEVGLKLLGFMIDSSATRAERKALERKRESLYLSQYLFEIDARFHRQTSGFEEFRRREGIPERDPWGGRLHLSSSGRVDSTTPREAVLGIR